MVDQPDGAVVVGVDGTTKDERAVDWAADEAAGTGARLHVLYCFPVLPQGLGVTPSVDVAEFGADIAGRARDRALVRYPELTVTTEVIVEDPAVGLVRASHHAHAVVIGARGLGGIAGRLLGSVSQKVAAHATGPVVVVRDAPAAADGPVVVGVDPIDTDAHVLEFAFAQATRRGVPLRLVHAREPRPAGVDDPRVDRLLSQVGEHQAMLLAELAEDWSARHPEVAVDVREVTRHPVEALTAEGADACLLVVGSRGRRGLTGLRLGSVARGVLHEAPVVAVVRVAPATG